MLVVSTETGRLLKVVLLKDGRQQSLQVMDGPVRGITASPTMLYGLSGTQVFGEPLGRCEVYSDCEGCVESPDPFCGWCILKAKLVVVITN